MDTKNINHVEESAFRAGFQIGRCYGGGERTGNNDGVECGSHHLHGRDVLVGRQTVVIERLVPEFESIPVFAKTVFQSMHASSPLNQIIIEGVFLISPAVNLR